MPTNRGASTLDCISQAVANASLYIVIWSLLLKLIAYYSHFIHSCRSTKQLKWFENPATHKHAKLQSDITQNVTEMTQFHEGYMHRLTCHVVNCLYTTNKSVANAGYSAFHMLCLFYAPWSAVDRYQMPYQPNAGKDLPNSFHPTQIAHQLCFFNPLDYRLIRQ